MDFGTGGAGSDFDQLSDPPPPPKKTTARSRAAATKAPAKKAPAKKAPAKKAPAKGRGKKAVEPVSLSSWQSLSSLQYHAMKSGFG